MKFWKLQSRRSLRTFPDPSNTPALPNPIFPRPHPPKPQRLPLPHFPPRKVTSNRKPSPNQPNPCSPMITWASIESPAMLSPWISPPISINTPRTNLWTTHTEWVRRPQEQLKGIWTTTGRHQSKGWLISQITAKSPQVMISINWECHFRFEGSQPIVE